MMLRNLLLEGKYDFLVKEISTKLVRGFKVEIKHPRYNYLLVEFDIILKKNFFPGLKRIKIKATWDNIDDNDDLEIRAVTYREKSLVNIEITIFAQIKFQTLNKLVSRLKSTIRHEIEHVAQMSKRKQELEKNTEWWEDAQDLFVYLTSKTETPAFVQGSYRLAKSKKIPLDVAMEQVIKNIVDSGDVKFSRSKQELVKKKWIEYARKTIRTAKYSK